MLSEILLGVVRLFRTVGSIVWIPLIISEKLGELSGFFVVLWDRFCFLVTVGLGLVTVGLGSLRCSSL